MKLSKPLVLTIVLLAAALIIVLTASILKNNTQPLPSTFNKTFSGTGLVENISHSGSRCTIKVALYDWLNLSKDFPLLEIPSRNDRFSFIAEADVCNAAIVASTTANGHIAFEASSAKNNWYFIDRPIAGAGCGGYAISWTPEPEINN